MRTSFCGFNGQKLTFIETIMDLVSVHISENNFKKNQIFYCLFHAELVNYTYASFFSCYMKG